MVPLLLEVAAALSHMPSFLTHPTLVLKRSQLRRLAGRPERQGASEPLQFSGRARRLLSGWWVERVLERPRRLVVVVAALPLLEVQWPSLQAARVQAPPGQLEQFME